MNDNVIYPQTKEDFIKVINDDCDNNAWEHLHFAREWLCILERKETATAWAHWVREGYEATARSTTDPKRLGKAIAELEAIAANEGDK